jgi:hypothetical protein|tara:strand:- start:340 stop:651 length:312 start_codon:yes stop_codon:yes gene_type:complete
MSTNKIRIDDFITDIQNFKKVLSREANYEYLEIEGYKEKVNNLINNTASFIAKTKGDLIYLENQFTAFVDIVNKINEAIKQKEKINNSVEKFLNDTREQLNKE